MKKKKDENELTEKMRIDDGTLSKEKKQSEHGKDGRQITECDCLF